MSHMNAQEPAVTHTPWAKKAVRRSPNTWVNGYPRSVGKRAPQEKVESQLVRFPHKATGTGALRDSSKAVAERAQLVRVEWTAAERELRRLQAARKQEELLMLLAEDHLEECMRLAVANGELPVPTPTLESCEL